MTDREIHEAYVEMRNIIPNLTAKIKEAIVSAGFKPYDVYLSVAKEESGEFFCDIEYGNGTPDGYHRIRTNWTMARIMQYFKIKEV